MSNTLLSGQLAVGQQPIRLSLLARVLLPLAGGYFLSYFFRTVNSVLAGRLTHEFQLDAATLGLMTSAYFLAAMAVQLPLGVALDRYGPRPVQVACMTLAAAGAMVFALASTPTELFVGRTLIGLGVGSALMAGLKAIVIWFPKERVALLNGCFIGLGALGALLASAPTEWLLANHTWRDLFVMLAAASLMVACMVLLAVPSRPDAPAASSTMPAVGLRQIYADVRFWRLAPLAALVVGTAWSMQGLWIAPWLSDVALLPPGAIAEQLFYMALALCVGAVGLGILADRLRRRSVGPEVLLAVVALLLVIAEMSLAFNWSLPSLLPLAIVGVVGAGTTLSYTVTANLFPKESVARANTALNVLNFGAAFAVQWLVGAIVSQWPRDAAGHYPPAAYAAAFLLLATLQLVALLWFLRPLRPDAVSIEPVAAETSTVWRAPFTIVAACSLAALLIGTAWKLGVPAIAQLQAMPAAARQGADVRPELAKLEEHAGRTHKEISRLEAANAAQASEIRELRTQVGVLADRLAGIEREIKAIALASDRRAQASEAAKVVSAAAGPVALEAPVAAPCEEPGSDRRPAPGRPIVIHFARYQSTLDAGDMTQLDRLAGMARSCPLWRVLIESHTDSAGSAATNERLSQRRGEKVAAFLATRGVEASRIDIEALGASRPIAANDTEHGRASNRRVELTLQRSAGN